MVFNINFVHVLMSLKDMLCMVFVIRLMWFPFSYKFLNLIRKIFPQRSWIPRMLKLVTILNWDLLLFLRVILTFPYVYRPCNLYMSISFSNSQFLCNFKYEGSSRNFAKWRLEATVYFSKFLENPSYFCSLNWRRDFKRDFKWNFENSL